MLESLVLRNFQCHRQLTVNFSPTVTTLVGPNDSGKSAVLRALRYVLTNKPRGVAHVHHGAKFCSVTLKVDGHYVRRVSGKKSVYSLDKKKFKAFRSDVPREIARLVNVSEINFQRQHDPIFWLSLSPGNLARELNRLVDLQTIDAVQAWIAKRCRMTTTEIDVCTRRKAEAAAVISELKNIENLDKFLTKLQKLHENDLPSLLQQATSIRSALKSAYVLRRFITSSAGVAADVQGLSTLASQLTHENMTIAALRHVLTHCAACQSSLRDDIDLPAADALKRRAGTIQKVTRQGTALRRLVEQISTVQKEIESCEQLATARKQKIESELNGRCPLCYGILTNQSPV